MSINDFTKNGLLASGGISYIQSNDPKQYQGRQKQYFAGETELFTQEYAKYSGNFFEAEAQGFDTKDPSKWQKVKIRMANVVRPSAAITRQFDDYKNILMENPKFGYLTPGAKIKTMGSTWLVTNPDNLASVTGSGIVERCNAIWRFLDFYGNVKEEPIRIEKGLANASDSDAQDSGLITKGYFHIKAQHNPFTAQLDTNSRIILGKGAYRITGFTDFIQEFTEDIHSVRLVEFTARYEEPNKEIDDLKNRVAGGKEFRWNMNIEGQKAVAVGGTTKINISNVRNGDMVESSDFFPITYIFQSLDPDIATVDTEGNITGLALGTTTIRAYLFENQNIYADFEIAVDEFQSDAGFVDFIQSGPTKITAFENATFEAAFFEDGLQSQIPVQFSFSGADENAYSTEINKNSVTIYAWSGSVVPLEITASYKELSKTITVGLEGV